MLFQFFKSLIILTVFILLSPYNQFADNRTVCFIISRKIKPYIEMIDGFYENLKLKSTLIDISEEKVNKQKFSKCYWVVSAGTKANKFLNSLKLKKNKIYTFFIYKNEYSNFFTDNLTAGIYLYPEAKLLIPFFKKNKITKLIAPYTEKRVYQYLIKTKQIFKEFNTEIILKKISNFKEMEVFIQKNRGKILWILPDKLYSSLDLIDYLLKIATENNVKVVGFNRYFYEIGARFSVIINYKKIGKVIADIIKNNKTGIYSSPFYFKGE